MFSESDQPLEKPNYVNFEGYTGDWQDQALLTAEGVEMYRAGRLGGAFLFMGMYLTMMGCKMFVPESADDHADDDTMAEVGGGDENFDDDEEEMLPPSEFWTPLLWKRTHMLLFCYGTCVGLLFLWEFSYSEFAEGINGLIEYFLRLGVTKGDRISWLGLNHYKAVEIFFACSGVGAIFVPIKLK